MALSLSTALHRAQGGTGRGVRGAGESTRRHFLWGQEDSGKGMRSSEGEAVSNLPLPSTEKPALGGSDLSVLGGAIPSNGQPSHVCWAVTQQV